MRYTPPDHPLSPVRALFSFSAKIFLSGLVRLFVEQPTISAAIPPLNTRPQALVSSETFSKCGCHTLFLPLRIVPLLFFPRDSVFLELVSYSFVLSSWPSSVSFHAELPPTPPLLFLPFIPPSRKIPSSLIHAFLPPTVASLCAPSPALSLGSSHHACRLIRFSFKIGPSSPGSDVFCLPRLLLGLRD